MSKLKDIFKSYVDMQNHFFSVKIVGKDAGINLGVSFIKFDANILNKSKVNYVKVKRYF